jgi:hypothetical protein
MPAGMLRTERPPEMFSEVRDGTAEAPFVGRLEALFGIDELCGQSLERLRKPAGPHVLGFHGIGGVGKSSLADAIARRAFEEGIVVDIVFLRSRKNAGAGEGLTFARCHDALAQRLRLGSDASSERIASSLRQRPILIYLDNLETSAEPQNTLVARIADLIEGTLARVVLTSRQVYADHRVFAQRLTGIEKDACRELIQHLGAHIPGMDSIGDAELDAIFAATGGVPLAIRLVVPQFGTDSLNRVLARLKVVTPVSVEDAHYDEYQRFYHEIISWSWNAVWERGNGDGRGTDAGVILTYLADMPPTPSGAADVPTLAALTDFDDARVWRAVNVLFRFSLIEVLVPPDVTAERRFFLHPLVQQYVEADLIQRSHR